MKIFKLMLLTGMLMTGVANAMSQEFDVDQFNSRWESAFNDGDTKALAGLYSDQAVVVPPSQEIVSSPRSIQAFWAEKRRNGTSDFSYTPVNARNEGSRIYQTGTWSAIVRSNGVDTRLGGDMTQVIVQQSDGSWKIDVQSWQ